MIRNLLSTTWSRPLLRLALTALALAAATAGGPSQGAQMLSRPWPQKTATPPLALTGMDGAAVDLAQWRGKVVILNFWASWCGPCVDELPAMNELADSHGAGADVVVVGVNYKESAPTIARFSAEHAFRYPIFRDQSGTALKPWTGGVLPATILIDRSGQARWRVIGEFDRNDAAFKDALKRALAPRNAAAKSLLNHHNKETQ